MIQAIKTVLQECWIDRKRLLAISAYNLSFQNNQTKLKLLWTVLNPTLQAATYWLAYNVGLRITSPIQGIPYLAWMLTGLIPWFFISMVMTNGAMCMVSARVIFRNMMIIIQLFSGVRYTVGVLWLFYYMAAAFLLMLGYTFFFSTLTVFVRDIAKIIQSVVRLLFFITPICWSLTPDNPLAGIMKWNPIVYIIDGYRDTMLYHGIISASPEQHLSFWAVTAVLLLLGTWLHWKLRDSFIDYL